MCVCVCVCARSRLCACAYTHKYVVTERKELKVNSLFCYAADTVVLLLRCSCCIVCIVKDIFSLSLNVTHQNVLEI
jgi:hypothetical protein